jgi:hypothetical protein
VRAGRHRFGENRAVHVGVTARLVHQRAAKVISVRPQPFTLGEHRLAVR